MTALVGIYCKNGIVIASDSALTVNGIIEQIYSNKLVVDPARQLITAFSCSDLGFAQRYRNKIVKEWDTPAKDIEEKINNLSRIGLEEFYDTHYPQHKLKVPASFLIGFVQDGEHYLIGLPEGGFQPVRYDQYHWYCTIGSGSEIIAPLIGFIREIYWQNGAPNIAQAIFHAYMCLHLAIKINTGGVNGDIHIGVIQRDEKTGQYTTKKQDDYDMLNNKSMHEAAMSYYGNFLEWAKTNFEPIPKLVKPKKKSQKPKAS